MFIIFGTRRMRRQLGIVLMMCPRCQRPCAHAIVRLQSWFTLFFIPLIPMGTKYFTACSLCGGATRTDKAHAETLQHAAAQQQGPEVVMTPDGPMTAPAAPPDAATTVQPSAPTPSVSTAESPAPPPAQAGPPVDLGDPSPPPT
jgi:zinc-ribbon family